MAGVIVVYTGLILMAAGALTLLRPLALLHVPTRGHAAAVLAAGIVVALVGVLLPAPETRVGMPRTQLDAFLPAYQFSEHHEIHVRAAPERVMEAIHAVTAGEIALFQTLTTIRRFGRKGPESILNAPERMPILEVATRTTFLTLAAEPGREILLGTLVAVPAGFRRPERATPEWFRGLEGPGYAKAAMNFLVEPDGRGGTRLTTDTRVFATDVGARRRFAAYWRVIYPGSALLRRTWLRAIRRRAEAPR